jgi:hypothetical protein
VLARLTAWMRNEDRIEIVEAVLLSVATVGTAWSAYQAALWDGEQSALYTEASAARADGNRLSDVANVQVAIDLSEYETWLSAATDGNTQLASLIRGQMREEMQVALDAWLEAGGLSRTRPAVPASPFSMEQYTVSEREESADRIANAEEHFADGETANRRSDKYVLVTVVFALVLFIVGIGSKFKAPHVRSSLAGFAAAALVVGTSFMLSLPVAALTP